METSVLRPLNFTISLPSAWEKEDAAWEAKPNPLHQRACICVMAKSRGGPRRAPRVGRTSSQQRPSPKISSALVLSLAVSLPGWDAQMVSLWVWSLGLLSSESFQKSGLGRARRWDVRRSRAMPSLRLHLLHKPSGACSPPRPTTLPQRLEKNSLIFLTLMKTRINKAKRFLCEE